MTNEQIQDTRAALAAEHKALMEAYRPTDDYRSYEAKLADVGRRWRLLDKLENHREVMVKCETGIVTLQQEIEKRRRGEARVLGLLAQSGVETHPEADPPSDVAAATE